MEFLNTPKSMTILIHIFNLATNDVPFLLCLKPIDRHQERWTFSCHACSTDNCVRTNLFNNSFNSLFECNSRFHKYIIPHHVGGFTTMAVDNFIVGAGVEPRETIISLKEFAPGPH